MPKNNENINRVKNSNSVNTNNENVKESIFLSEDAIKEIEIIRDFKSGGANMYKSLICDAMANLAGFVDEDTSSEWEKKAFINIITTLRLYNNLIDALAQIK